jgi:CRP-like cAMP-binding protein
VSAIPPELVRSAGIFVGLDTHDVGALTGLATMVQAADGEYLVEESAKGQDFFIIVQGRVDIHVSLPDGGASESLALLKEGDTLGESVLLGRIRRIASAQAKGPVEALKWDVTALSAYFDAHPRAGYVVMRNLARIVHERLTATNMLLRNTINRVVDML